MDKCKHCKKEIDKYCSFDFNELYCEACYDKLYMRAMNNRDAEIRNRNK